MSFDEDQKKRGRIKRIPPRYAGTGITLRDSDDHLQQLDGFGMSIKEITDCDIRFAVTFMAGADGNNKQEDIRWKRY